MSNAPFEGMTKLPDRVVVGQIGGGEYYSTVETDEGMGLCAGAFMGGKRACIIMQNTAIGVTINSLVTLIQYYNIPLPMLISYRGEVGEKVACQAEMAVHTKALLAQLARIDVLILDDWGLTPLDPTARHDLLEVIDDRIQGRAAIITSQLPIEHWHAWLNDPTLADAILDRLVHQAYRLNLKGDSLRKIDRQNTPNKNRS